MKPLEEYFELVKIISHRIALRLPTRVSAEELFGAGFTGLMEAYKRFDETRGVKFETYCTNRIRGAILDELRRMDWVPRLVRTRGEDPIKMVNFTDMGGTNSEKGGLQARLAWVIPSAAEAALRNRSARSIIDTVELRATIKALLRTLNNKARKAMMLYYLEGLTMKEVAYYMHLSESRVCQIIAKARKTLRKALIPRKRQQ